MTAGTGRFLPLFYMDGPDEGGQAKTSWTSSI